MNKIKETSSIVSQIGYLELRRRKVRSFGTVDGKSFDYIAIKLCDFVE